MQVLALRDHGRARTDEWEGHRVPAGILVEHEECIPVDPPRLIARPYVVEMFSEPRARQEISIPVLEHALVIQHVGIPVASRIAWKYGQPHGVNTEIAVGAILQDVIVDPTGPCQAFPSGGRQQNDQTGMTAVLIEGGLKLGHLRQVVQRRCRPRRRSFEATGRQQK